jgi:hypothetical protein
MKCPCQVHPPILCWQAQDKAEKPTVGSTVPEPVSKCSLCLRLPCAGAHEGGHGAARKAHLVSEGRLPVPDFKVDRWNGDQRLKNLNCFAVFLAPHFGLSERKTTMQRNSLLQWEQTSTLAYPEVSWWHFNRAPRKTVTLLVSAPVLPGLWVGPETPADKTSLSG